MFFEMKHWAIHKMQQCDIM